MPGRNNKAIISKASPHTIKKFEVVDEYIKSWAQKLMLNKACSGLIFIDCMCNSGIYTDDSGNTVEGTPIRVAKTLLDVARTYKQKQVYLYFNDLSEEKINELKKHLPKEERNYKIQTLHEDANEFLKRIGPQLNGTGHLHYFLFYDPYDADIDWAALLPFFRNWGEVMINHAVLDPIRAIGSAKKKETKEKYERTYLAEFEKLLPYGKDKETLERRIETIMKNASGKQDYYVAAFPFYNRNNSNMYYLVHGTSNQAGFKLYKKTAWKVFGGQSATKKSKVDCYQLSLDFVNGGITTQTDESCYQIADISKFVQSYFAGQQNVPIETIWAVLDEHPVFPSEGFRNDIKRDLVKLYGATKSTISGANGRKEVFSFLPKCCF